MSKSEALSELIQIRLTRNEKKAIERVSKNEGLSLSAWIREILNRAVS